MASVKICVLTFLVIISTPFIVAARRKNNGELKLVHLIFRHGERTTDISTIYPKDPYRNETYYPYGLGQLTNKGRKTEFLLGKKLRKRYNGFLGDVYTPDLLDAFSTQVDRTKASLQLVLAGLFPPKRTPLEWERDLNWQPIPFRSLSFADDPLLTFPQVYCPRYAKLFQEYLNSPEGCEIEQKYSDIFPYLSEHTGLNVTSTADLRLLYYGLATEMEWGFKLPSWSNRVFPDILEKGTIDFFIQSCATPELKQLAGGFLLKKIINDSRAKLTTQLVPQNRKLFLYSSHEFNVAFILNTLEVFFPHSPPYGSCVMIEVHTINNIDGVKIFYEDYSRKEPKILKIPGCDYFCPFDKFTKLVQKNLPASDNSCQEELTVNLDKEKEVDSTPEVTIQEEVTVNLDKEKEGGTNSEEVVVDREEVAVNLNIEKEGTANCKEEIASQEQVTVSLSKESAKKEWW